jgi:two-component SAPR family response regulator
MPLIIYCHIIFITFHAIYTISHFSMIDYAITPFAADAAAPAIESGRQL